MKESPREKGESKSIPLEEEEPCTVVACLSVYVDFLTSGIIGDLATLPVQTFGMAETVTIPTARVIGSPVTMTSPSLRSSFMTSLRGTAWTRSRFTSQGCPMEGCSYGVE